MLNYLCDKLGLRKLNFQDTGMREVKAAKKKSESICGIWHLDLESKLDFPEPNYFSFTTGVVTGMVMMKIIAVMKVGEYMQERRGHLHEKPAEDPIQTDVNITSPTSGGLNFPEVVYFTKGGNSRHSSRTCRALKNAQRQLHERHKCGHCVNDFNFQDSAS